MKKNYSCREKKKTVGIAPCLPFALSTALLHSDLQTLWKQQASLAVLPKQEKEKGEEEEEEEGRLGSEQEREIMRAERKRRDSSMKEVGLRTFNHRRGGF